MDKQETVFINNSGQGKNIKVDDIIAKRFNWGAFLLTWIWGIFNKTYITLIILLICILPKTALLIILLVLAIWFGIKGNTWAWQNKQWKSIEHFHSVQKKWAIAGIVPIIIMILFCILAANFLINQTPEAYPDKFGKIIITKQSSHIYKILEENRTLHIKCPTLSNELAVCIAKKMDDELKTRMVDTKFKPVSSMLKDNIIHYDDLNKTIFTSDGICKDKNNCKIDFILSHETATKGGTASATVYLYIDNEGYIRVKDKNPKNYKFTK